MRHTHRIVHTYRIASTALRLHRGPAPTKSESVASSLFLSRLFLHHTHPFPYHSTPVSPSLTTLARATCERTKTVAFRGSYHLQRLGEGVIGLQCSKGYNHFPFNACVHTCTTCIRRYTHALMRMHTHAHASCNTNKRMYRLTGVLEQLHSQIVFTFTSTDPKKPLDNISLKARTKHAINKSMMYTHTHMYTHRHTHANTYMCTHTHTHIESWTHHTLISALHSLYCTCVHELRPDQNSLGAIPQLRGALFGRHWHTEGDLSQGGVAEGSRGRDRRVEGECQKGQGGVAKGSRSAAWNSAPYLEYM